MSARSVFVVAILDHGLRGDTVRCTGRIGANYSVELTGAGRFTQFAVVTPWRPAPAAHSERSARYAR
jgi:hypothetical protein